MSHPYSALEVVVTANLRQAESDIAKGMTSAGEQGSKAITGHFQKGFAALKPIAGQIGKAAVTGLGLATTAAVAFAAKSYKAAEESNKIGAQTAAVIKSTGGAANITKKQVDQLSASIMAKTGIDDDNVKAGQNMLLTFTNVRNEAGKGNDVFNQASSTLVDLTAAMTGGKVTGEALSKQAIQLGKALNDPIKGVTALSRVGVTFTDQQKKQIATLVQSGHTVEAQKIILHELNKEFGGTAAATATFSERLKTAYGNVQEAVGGVVGQAINPLLGQLGQLATKFGAAISPGGRLAPIMTALGSAASKLVAPLGAVVGKLSAWLSNLKPEQISAVADAIKKFGPAAAALGAGAAAITGAGIFTQLPVIGPMLSSLVGPLKTIIPLIGGEAGLAGAFKALTGPWGIILTIFATLMAVSPQFRSAVMGLVTALITALMPAVTAILAALKPLFPLITMIARMLGGILAPIIKALTPLIVQLTPIIALLAMLVGKLLGVVLLIITPILKVYMAFEKWYVMKILVPLINILVGALTWLVKIITSVVKWIMGGSPGLVPAFLALQRIVTSVTNTIRNVVIAGFTAIRNAIQAAWRFITQASSAAWTTIKNVVTGAVRALVGAVTSGFNTIKSAASRALSWLVGAVRNIAGGLRSAGADAIHALLSGITGALAGIGSWVKSHIVDPVVNAVKHFFGIHSPSDVMAEVGHNVTAGFIEGIVSMNPLAIARNVFGSMPAALGSLISKGFADIAALPGKAISALAGLGGKLGGILGNIGGFFKGIFSSGGGGAAAGVMQWAGIMRAVLAMKGVPQLFGTFMSQMSSESGGNPRAINLWDSNAKAGIPSKGLMQVIDPTFAAYAGPFRSRGIWDPMANIYAAVSYALSRYGRNITAVLGHGHGYAKGGVVGEPVVGLGLRTGLPYSFGERGPELVSPLSGQAPSLGARAQPVVVNVYPRAHQSEVEIAAAVSRSLAWAEATGRVRR